MLRLFFWSFSEIKPPAQLVEKNDGTDRCAIRRAAVAGGLICRRRRSGGHETAAVFAAAIPKTARARLGG